MLQGELPGIKVAREAAVKEKVCSILNELDGDLKIALLSDLMLDQIRVMINKFPAQYQQEIVVLLAEGFLEQWKKSEA